MQLTKAITIVLLVVAMPVSLFFIARWKPPTDTVVVSDCNGIRTVATLCWTRQECADNIASICQEGFTIEHYFGNEMIGKCAH